MNNKPHVILLPITTYKTPKGKHTCASSFERGEVCLFHATQRMGLEDTCWFSGKSGKRWEILERDNDGIGYLIPHAGCPLAMYVDAPL